MDDFPGRDIAAGSAPDPEDPDHIGSYRILGVLGEGGMGMVYLAEQSEPVRRRVALKIIKLGMDTRQVVARFESERQALAVMDHPHIAKVFDGGATETGRPYFVMELVRGTPLTEYADTHKLTTNERLQLFLDVCHAVQHAHQKGVIHRDLKPSNVLVEVRESEPVVKVIDFGIAKAMGRELTDRTLVTQLGQMIGTPEYMSPEQAEMSGLDVDTRTDIYALGVMLYELVVGALPFDLSGKPEHAIPHSLRERVVPRPSMRLTSLGQTQTTIADLRRTTPDYLRREIKGDLDWIILKALEKDRTRRYETANGLAMDIQRHLDDEPVLARPPSARYRIGKFVRRNRGVVTAGAVAVLAILLGAGAATVGMVNARTERARAEREAAAAERVSAFLVDLFRVSDPGEARGNAVTAREILDEGASRIDAELAETPLIQARLMRTMGDVYMALGLYDQALPLLERAVQVSERTGGDHQAELAHALQRLGVIHRRRDDNDKAEEALRRALAIDGDVEDADPLEATAALRSLSGVFIRQGRWEEADSVLRQVLALQEERLGPDHADVAATLSNLGIVAWQKGEYDEAAAAYTRTIEIRERTLGADHPSVGNVLNNLGALFYETEKYDDALGSYERAHRVFVASYGPDHPSTASAVHNIAEARAELNDAAGAERDFLAALEVKRRVLPPGHRSIAASLAGLAGVYRDASRYAEADTLYIEAIDIRQRSGDPRLGETLDDYAVMLRAAGRDTDAAVIERQSRSLR